MAANPATRSASSKASTASIPDWSLLPTGDWPDRLYAGGCADITLTASTTYWIVFGSSEWLPSSYYLVARADTTNQDPGNNAAWSIGDTAKMRLHTNTEIGRMDG